MRSVSTRPVTVYLTARLPADAASYSTSHRSASASAGASAVVRLRAWAVELPGARRHRDASPRSSGRDAIDVPWTVVLAPVSTISSAARALLEVVRRLGSPRRPCSPFASARSIASTAVRRSSRSSGSTCSSRDDEHRSARSARAPARRAARPLRIRSHGPRIRTAGSSLRAAYRSGSSPGRRRAVHPSRGSFVSGRIAPELSSGGRILAAAAEPTTVPDQGADHRVRSRRSRQHTFARTLSRSRNTSCASSVRPSASTRI